MRIRKRTPARAASPGPPRHRSESPPAPQQLKQEKPHEKEEEEEEEAVGAGEDEDLVPTASNNSLRRAMGVQKPDSEQGTAALPATRCSRNDGKRWRCKSEAVPGHLFCNRHIAWSRGTRRKPRDSRKNRRRSVLELERTKEEGSGEDEARNKYEAAIKAGKLPCNGGGDEINYYGGGGFQPGSH